MAAVGLAITLHATSPDTSGPTKAPDRQTVATPSSGPLSSYEYMPYTAASCEGEAVHNGTAQTPIGELAINCLALDDPRALSQEYLRQHPEAKAVIISMVSPEVDSDKRFLWSGGYLGNVLKDGVSAEQASEIFTAAAANLPKDTIMYDGPISRWVNDGSQLIVQVAGANGQVETVMLPIKPEPTHRCEDDTTITSAVKLRSDYFRSLCATAGLIMPYQGAEGPTKIYVYARNAEMVRPGPLAKGPRYHGVGTADALYLAPRAEGLTRLTVIHEATHDIYANLPQRERKNLNDAYALLVAVSPEDLDSNHPVWQAHKESNYMNCTVASDSCEPDAGHPYDGVGREDVSNEMFASTNTILTVYSTAYLQKFEGLDTQARIASAASVGATLHAIYSMNSDAQLLDKTHPDWRSTVTILDNWVLTQNNVPNLPVFKDLHEMAVIAAAR